MTEPVVHQAPAGCASSAPCCGEQVFDLPRTDRMTSTETVTCPEAAEHPHVDHLDEMTAQQCPAGVHADWAVNSEHAHACPWCELDRLRAELEQARAAHFREAARLIEEVGLDDDAVNLLDNVADGLTAAPACSCRAETVHQTGSGGQA